MTFVMEKSSQAGGGIGYIDLFRLLLADSSMIRVDG